MGMTRPITRSTAMWCAFGDGPSREYTWTPCERCDGKGFISHDNWRTFMVEGGEPWIVNMGSVIPCCTCDRGGVLCHAYSTRGVSAVPLIRRKPETAGRRIIRAFRTMMRLM